ncbi:MAG: catechol 2,3-dioxygenase-like lactoylglutathione lyase family enzyme [Kiritimatiellia bacterium]|jgi:catechol 2,3-dioxygenase-like lactoylglutathione lyase family enzyme
MFCKHTIPSLAIATLALCAPLQAQDSAFTTDVVHFGVVVSDIDASVAFYTDVVGFTSSGDFKVSGDIASSAGLTKQGIGLHVHVLTLGDGESATKLKLMQVADAKPKKLKNTYIHSTLGMSYMTVMVADTKAAIARAAKHGVTPLKQGPVDLGEGKMFLTLLRDPDGNFVELVGP